MRGVERRACCTGIRRFPALVTCLTTCTGVRACVRACGMSGEGKE